MIVAKNDAGAFQMTKTWRADPADQSVATQFRTGQNIFSLYPVPCFGYVKAQQDRTIKNEVIPLIKKVADS